MKKISLYIHIPFCKQKCLYCDFLSFSSQENYIENYIDALVKEIKSKCKDFIISSIFIGGGTPSYLDEDNLEKILKVINDLNLEKNLEFTIECNPSSVIENKLKLMKKYNVNRLSFGLQSTDNTLLKKIGRVHNYEKFVENFNLARKLGFENINIDIMYGLPEQTVENWEKTLNDIVNLNPEHISAYSLIVEEGTPFFNMNEKGVLNLPNEEQEREMDFLTKKILSENGYNQYEISNFSKLNKECKHNIVYWTLEEYIGVGVGSSSYIDRKRITNISIIDDYIKKINNNEKVFDEIIENTTNNNIEEFVFMGLRMVNGISLSKFENKFGINIYSIYSSVIRKNIESKLLIVKGDIMKLTVKGLELSNKVMADFLLD